MKKLILLGFSLAVVAAAQATLYTFNFTGGAIPDGNPAGATFTTADLGTLDGGPGIGFGGNTYITDVNVRLNISGGYNGDLYGYLVHESGFAVLLNRIGRTSTDAFGSAGAGMNVTLDDDAVTDIHLAGSGVLGGSYRPDARTDNPASVTDSIANQTAWLDDFDTMDPNGSWTLFLADMAGGDTSTVLSWGLDIQAVPEPVTWALIGFGTLVGGVNLGRWLRRRSSQV